MKIKVCGMKDPENIRQVLLLEVEMLGFVFHKDSPRFVKNTPSVGGNLSDYANEEVYDVINGQPIEKVGVFKDEMPQDILTQVYNYSLDYVQLQGEESPIYIENLRRTLVPDFVPELGIIKAIPIADVGSLRQTKDYEGVVDAFLFTLENASFDDDKQKFDWHILDYYQGEKPFFLGGGIDIIDAEELLSLRHPRFVGVDLTTNFEQSVGIKDVEKLKKMVNILRYGGERMS